MNRRIPILVVMLGALFALMSINAMGQSKELVAHIPFNFTVCNQQLPAGRYRVRPISSTTTNLLLVRSEDGQFAQITCTHDVQSSKPASGPKLVFNRYGNQYFLAELWFPGEMTGSQALKSEREEAVIRDLGLNRKGGRVTVKVTEMKPN